MAKLLVKGGTKLKGEIKVSGSKNAALPIICASLLTKEKTILENIPDIADVHSMVKIAESLGAKVTYKDHTIEI
ncbi:UDP-N-acetylglucosamine 1-carboxyvinyltransferase, partial [Candidatus Peregrinibacteria bacterium]|nr:UDP-N-acetylglucosamine 1-carboxyvinyltransferase [Candidatus Peregrinibacteria bacterium]